MKARAKKGRPRSAKPARQARAPATPARREPRGMSATPQIEVFLSQWKQAYIAERQAKQDVELARTLVNGAFDANGVDFFTSKLGTISRGHRAPKVHIDWEALCRKLVPPKKIDEHIADFTTSSGGGPVLAAPSGWSAEAGC